jgi:hypothetical protein
MGRGMQDGEEQQGVCDLPVEPNVLVEREEPDLWSEEPHNRPAYWYQDDHGVDGQY